jgi:thiol-disulfide isomerase/thioredoxin
MSTRVTVLVGLLAGAATAAIALAAIVAFGPEPTAGATPPPLLPSGSLAPAPASPAAPPSAGTAPSGPPGSGPSPATGLFHIGEPAPPLAVVQVGGGMIDLAALRGKPVWINFMATWCPPCIDEFPLMNGFAARYAGDGLVVVAVDVGEDEGTVAAFAERLGASFPIGLDRDGGAQDAWEAVALPVHFWVDADGVVRDGALGGIGPDVMADGLRAIMPGVEVTP